MRVGNTSNGRADRKYHTSPSKPEAWPGLAGLVAHPRKNALQQAKTSRTTPLPQFRPRRPNCIWSPLPSPTTRSPTSLAHKTYTAARATGVVCKHASPDQPHQSSPWASSTRVDGERRHFRLLRLSRARADIIPPFWEMEAVFEDVPLSV